MSVEYFDELPQPDGPPRHATLCQVHGYYRGPICARCHLAAQRAPDAPTRRLCRKRVHPLLKAGPCAECVLERSRRNKARARAKAGNP